MVQHRLGATEHRSAPRSPPHSHPATLSPTFSTKTTPQSRPGASFAHPGSTAAHACGAQFSPLLPAAHAPIPSARQSRTGSGQSAAKSSAGVRVRTWRVWSLWGAGELGRSAPPHVPRTSLPVYQESEMRGHKKTRKHEQCCRVACWQRWRLLGCCGCGACGRWARGGRVELLLREGVALEGRHLASC
jgi:hypothetical protein